VQTASEYFARALGKTAGAIVGQHLSALEGAWSFTELQERIRGSAATSSPFERVPIVVEGEDSSRRTVWVTGRWLPWHESPDTQVLVLAISAQEATPPGTEV